MGAAGEGEVECARALLAVAALIRGWGKSNKKKKPKPSHLRVIDGGADEVTIALIGLGYRAAQEGDGLVFHRKGPARRKAAAQDGAKQIEAPEGATEGATAERSAAAGQEVPGRSKQGKKGPRRGKPPKGKADTMADRYY